MPGVRAALTYLGVNGAGHLEGPPSRNSANRIWSETYYEKLDVELKS